MSTATPVVRVGFYGCGRFANRTHIPNLLNSDDCRIVALCDARQEALDATTARFGLEVPCYTDAHAMLAEVRLDALYSVVPAFARSDVEQRAAGLGMAIFSEKPQANSIALALAIDRAIAKAGVVSTVGYRERYNPVMHAARAHLADKRVVHVMVPMIRDMPQPSSDRRAWQMDMDKFGGWAHDWGGHATDTVRFITGLEVTQAQGWEVEHDAYALALGQSLHMRLSNGATMTQTYLMTGRQGRPERPVFEVFYEGGWLAIQRHGGKEWSLTIDGQQILRQVNDPWLTHDRLFVEAVRRQDPSLLLNDYHDGLYSLAPILAARASARRGGDPIALDDFLRDA